MIILAKSIIFCIFLFTSMHFAFSVSTRIVTGPVIGKVTNTTARVLLEFNTAQSITVILTAPDGTTFTSKKDAKAYIPVPFAFQNLRPATTYTVTLNDPNINIIESYFTTLSGESGNLKFAFVSCNDRKIQQKVTPSVSLWVDLLTKVQNKEIQYLFHIGDQLYMDGSALSPSASNQCLDLLKLTPMSEWKNVTDTILEIIRNEYRETWNVEATKQTLAKVPSLMIFDDHDVVNDWGFSPKGFDPTTADYLYGALVRQVYYEYERQLREDVNFDDLSTITQEYFYEVLNDIGFFFIEYRGVRTWERNISQLGSSHLGKVQTELLQQVLDPNGGEFANLTNFFLVSTLALLEPGQEGYVGQKVTNHESWGYAYTDERAELFNTLRAWKLAKEGREVTILGGDTHIGSVTQIFYNNEVIFTQLVASSICSFPSTNKEMASFNFTTQIQKLVTPWEFQHQSLTNMHNYGIIDVKNDDNVPTVSFSQVTRRSNYREEEEEMDKCETYSGTACGVCKPNYKLNDTDKECYKVMTEPDSDAKTGINTNNNIELSNETITRIALGTIIGIIVIVSLAAKFKKISIRGLRREALNDSDQIQIDSFGRISDDAIENKDL